MTRWETDNGCYLARIEQQRAQIEQIESFKRTKRERERGLWFWEETSAAQPILSEIAYGKFGITYGQF